LDPVLQVLLVFILKLVEVLDEALGGLHDNEIIHALISRSHFAPKACRAELEPLLGIHDGAESLQSLGI
jgi:hypothetical protein